MKTQLLAIGFAAASMLSATAAAEMLPPGSTTSLSGWVPAAGGTEVHSQTTNFTATGVPIGVPTATGTVEQTVVQQLSGQLLFSLRITALMAPSDIHLTSVKVGQWAGFSVDTDFLLGSGLSSPGEASRSGGSGDFVSWSDFEGPMSDGKNTSWMQIETDAIGFIANAGRLVLEFSDGSRAHLAIAAPSTIPAPGAAALLLGAALCGIRRRR